MAKVQENPVRDAARRQEVLTAKLRENPVLDAAQRLEKNLAKIRENPVLDAARQLEKNLARFRENPALDAARQLEENLAKFRENPALNAARQLEENLARLRGPATAMLQAARAVADRMPRPLGLGSGVRELVDQFSASAKTVQALRSSVPGLTGAQNLVGALSEMPTQTRAGPVEPKIERLANAERSWMGKPLTATVQSDDHPDLRASVTGTVVGLHIEMIDAGYYRTTAELMLDDSTVVILSADQIEDDEE
jgi:hypothetical protein